MLGDRLKELREDYNLNQDELANMLGVTRSTISSYETSSILPSLEVAIKISDAFNVSLDYLTCRTKEKNNLNLKSKNDRDFMFAVIKLVDKYYKK